MGEKTFKVGEAGDRVEIGQDLARIDQACVMGARTLDGAGWVRTLATRRVVINVRRRATMRGADRRRRLEPGPIRMTVRRQPMTGSPP